jgi:2-succinyl-5-enolpyruvyl-6-hydroxy-3-cyclohexene-1-carboxylate synthase
VLIVDIENLEPKQKVSLNSLNMIEKTITILNQELINYFEVNFVEEMRKTLNQHSELLNGNSEVRLMDFSHEYLGWKKLFIEVENLIHAIDFEKMEHFKI